MREFIKTFESNESKVDLYSDVVVKTYNSFYYKMNETYDRRGEAYFLNKIQSTYFPKLIEFDDKHIVMQNLGDLIGSRKHGLNKDGRIVDFLKLVKWLRELKEELDKLGVEHRDINPSNILFDDKNGDVFTLIDFNWMIYKNDSLKLKNCPSYLNKNYNDDEHAIDKISINAIDLLLSRIGEKKYDGSSLKVGWVYHPIPFNKEFKFNVHKTAAINEYQDVLKYCPFVKEGNKTILDVGANVGFFSFQLAKLGNIVVAVEADPAVYESAEAIRIYKNIYNVKYINAKFNSDVLNDLMDFDLVLMLNIHMWLFKQLGPEKTMQLMKRLSTKCKQMLFQTAGAQSKGKYRVKELVDSATIKLYLEDCGFKNVVKLRDTTTHGGVRSLFLGEGK